jgi:hypothetical protein
MILCHNGLRLQPSMTVLSSPGRFAGVCIRKVETGRHRSLSNRVLLTDGRHLVAGRLHAKECSTRTPLVEPDKTASGTVAAPPQNRRG